LHHVAQQHEAAQVMGIAAQRQATQIFRLDELAFAVMRYSRCVNIVGPGGLKRAAGRHWRQQESGLFGRCPSRLSIHYAVFPNDYGTDPAQFSGQASVTPPAVMFTSFLCYAPGQTANLGVFGASNIVAAHTHRFANCCL
jgi:hypothetical protein